MCTDTQFSCATAGTSSASGYTMAEHCFKLCIGFRPTPHVSYLSGISATQNMSFSSKMAGIYEIKLNHANMFKVLETIPLTKVSHRTMPSIGGTGNYISPMMEWSYKVVANGMDIYSYHQDPSSNLPECSWLAPFIFSFNVTFSERPSLAIIF